MKTADAMIPGSFAGPESFGKRGCRRARKSVPMLLPVMLSAAALLIYCTGNPEPRKIKLSSAGDSLTVPDQAGSALYLEPAAKRTIAILFFENRTGDQKLEWLQMGLTEMLIRSLSRYQRLSVLTTERVYEVLARIGADVSRPRADSVTALRFADAANVQAYLTGSIEGSGDSLRVTVTVHEPKAGKVIGENAVTGEGLEDLFTMVDDLSLLIKDDLQLSRADTSAGGPGTGYVSYPAERF